MVNFLVVSTGYNCEKYAERFYKSLLSQTYENFTATIIDDCSDDKTIDILREINSDYRVSVYRSLVNRGSALRRWEAIRNFYTISNPETVIVLVGLDDELKPFALERIAKEYENGVWMTYGNWIDNYGKILNPDFLDYPEEVHLDRGYRNDVFRATGLNTFKKFLFDEFTEEDFKYNGEWVKATTESNLMFGLLEMCGKQRVGVIKEPIVIYNRRQDNTVNRMGREYQDEVLNYNKNRLKKSLHEKQGVSPFSAH